MNNTQLNSFLKQRLEHHSYLVSMIEEDEPFPYEVNTKKEAQIGSWSCQEGEFLSSPADSKEARYILMMPMILPSSSEKVNALIERFYSEGCESKGQQERTSLIVGINVRRSLDSSRLNSIDKIVQAWKRPRFSCGIVGFVWDQQYDLIKKGWSYDVYKTYRILHLIDKGKAKSVNNEMQEDKIKVPYVNIREFILASSLLKIAFKTCNNKVTYLGIADPDAVHFNQVIKGADQEIQSFKREKKDYPDLYCPGYEVSSEESEIIQIGVKIDRMVRTETNLQFGMGSYFTETFLLFRAKKLAGLSFVTKETKTNQNLESRRLYQNGVKNKVIDKDKIVHGGDQPICTMVMERMKTAFTRKNLVMEDKALYTSNALKCLTGLTYTHASPREWANNLYTVLPIKVHPTTKATIPIQEIYKVVHPIYAFYSCKGEKFTSQDFQAWLNNFEDYLLSINLFWGSDDPWYPEKVKGQREKDYKKYTDFLDSQFERLRDAFNELEQLNLPVEDIQKIYLAAFYSSEKMAIMLAQGRELIQAEEE